MTALSLDQNRPRVGLLALAIAVTLAASACGGGSDGSGRIPAGLAPLIRDFAADTRGGIAVAVIAGDGRAELSSAGSASPHGRTNVTDATSFRLASVTKTYLGALALMLIDDGLVALDAPLRSLFDEFGDWGDVTVRQLLSHTSGLPRTGPQVDPSTWRSPADIRLEPLCVPGACRNYADENFVLVGLAIERVTGLPLERVLRERILAPLGLDRTFLEPAEQPTPPVAEHPARPVSKPLPGVVANARDLARFGHALFDGELLTSQSLRAMIDFDATADIPCAPDCHMPERYGLGAFPYDFGACVVWGHDGSTGSFLGYVPARSQTIAVVTNVEPWPKDFGPSIVAAATGGACS